MKASPKLVVKSSLIFHFILPFDNFTEFYFQVDIQVAKIISALCPLECGLRKLFGLSVVKLYMY